ncbi:MAG TPA: UDP-galactopyranose mutase [Desulfarculaceae bacterium]|nr:UDP-galactopyranose mutase [Desulfarculaceae bacterium]
MIVGAGLTGAVFAQTLAEAGQKVLVVEQRDHVAGNCFDMVDSTGVMIHQYGAHIFHTDCEDVWNYLSRFTKWRRYEHEVIAFVDNDFIPIPFNFNTLEKVFPKEAPEIKEKFIETYGLKTKISVLELLNQQDSLLHKVGTYVYEKIFKHYTYKQWNLKPDQISPEVIARVPVYTDHDNRYFTDTYQGIPEAGYTAMIETMLSNPDIELQLNTSFTEICKFKNGKILLNNSNFDGKLIYSGPADMLFQHKFGHLPYRSLHFEFESLEQIFYQPKAVINYPNDHDFTRIIEAKHLTGQKSPTTTICREYPQQHLPRQNEPYYPLFTDESKQQFELYKSHADEYNNLILAGRLAEYCYYDMDDAVKNALEKARKLL